MKTSIKWFDNAKNAAPEEAALVGDVSIFLGEKNVTSCIDLNESRNNIRISLFGITNGIVCNWWKIFGQRDQKTSLKNFRSGFFFPDISLQFDGVEFNVVCNSTTYGSNFSFVNQSHEVLSRDQMETDFRQIIEACIHQLCKKNISETSISIRWDKILCSINNKQERIFCEAAGSLGEDPYNISDNIANFIESSESIFEDESLVEFISGSKKSDSKKLLEWVKKMIQKKKDEHILHNLREIVDNVNKTIQNNRANAAWVLGYSLAQETRRVLELEDRYRFHSFRDLANLFGANKKYNLAAKVEGIIALRHEDDRGVSIHVKNHGDKPHTPASHLFALARGIGDAVCFPEQKTSPINQLQSAYRQAAGRAFAAEFLAPISEIRSMINDGYSIEKISSDFGLSENVISHQIENEGRIKMASH